MRNLLSTLAAVAVLGGTGFLGVTTAPAAPAGAPSPVRSLVASSGGMLRVMDMGDSITFGNGDGKASGANEGYRCRLKYYLAAQGQQIDYVGSQANGACIDGDNQHEGHPGWTIDQLTAIAADRVITYQPDVVILMAGTNDLKLNLDTDHLADRLGVLIDTIKAAKPGVIVVASTLPAYPAANQAAWKLARGNIPVVAYAHGAIIAYGHNVTAGLLADGIHPSCVGYITLTSYIDYAVTWAIPSPTGRTWSPVWPANDCPAVKK